MGAEILLVEDDDAHAELIERSLERLDVDVRLTRMRHGEEAVAFLEGVAEPGAPARGALPRLVLLDLRLPRMGGHAVLAHLKAHPVLRRVPVVVLTTSSAPNDVRAAYDNHVNGYLVKPPELERLSSMLEEVALYWGELNVPSP